MADTTARAAAKPTVTTQDAAATRRAKPAPPAAPLAAGPVGLLHNGGPAMLLSALVQPKVVIGAPNDPFEREADNAAEQIAAGGAVRQVSRLPAAGLASVSQRKQADEEEEPAQTLAVQRQADEEEEPTQTLPVQRQADEEEEPTQTLPVQRQADEEEEPAQTLPVQRQADEEEEPAQTLPVQRQADEEEEEPVQTLPVQRRADEEEEEPVQTLALQRRAGEEEVHRFGDAVPPVSARTAAAIQSPGAGRPLAPTLRSRIEPYLAADLGGVRVHDGIVAQQAAASLRARAFTHRQHIFLGRGESPYNLGLMAHEATHVVQQGAAVQRLPLVSRAPEQVQRLPAFISDRLASYARHVPGYTLFTVIVGFNPLTGSRVEPSAMNLVEGVMGLVPFGTAIFDKLRELGILQRAFEWIEGELERFDLSLGRLERLIEEAYEEMDFLRLDPFDYNLGVLTRKFNSLLNDLKSFVNSLVDSIVEFIKEAAIGVAEGLLADNQAWALLKKVLQYDPLRGEEVNATTEEILADFLLLIGKEAELAQMQERGTLAETAAWLDTQFAIFTGLIAELGSLFSAAWDAIQPQNLPNLASNLQSLATRVFSFVQQVWDFASTVALKVLELIKKSLLGWLSSFADEVPGFHLITVILARNPFTEEKVPRTAENIIRGFITLLPGGNATYQQLAETGTISQAAAAIEGAMAELGISWELITGIFSGIWDSLTIDDLLDPIGAFTRIVEQFGEPIARVFAFIRVVLREVFTLILQLMNFPSDLIASIIGNAMQAFESIKNDPIGFIKNMLLAVKQGFSQFFDNILQHLLGGLVDWLFRGLREAGIEPPADLSLGSVLDFVLQVLGISMERIWQKLAERVGQETVDRIRGAIDRLVGIWTFVRDVQERGVAAIWEYIESQISGLWDMVLEQARNWIMERIVNRAIQWLLSLLDPTGIMPVINSFMAFFNAVQSAIEYLRDILAIVNDYVSTMAAIARGEIQPGAERLEQGLANAIPVAIGFLANQFGLGRIGDKIAEIVGGIRGLVDRALDWLIGRAVAVVQSVLAGLGFGDAGTEETPAAGGPGRRPLEESFDFMGESHSLRLAPSGEGSVVLEMASENWAVFPHVVRRLQNQHVAQFRADNHTTDADALNTALQRMIDEAESVNQPGGVIAQARQNYQRGLNAVPANRRAAWIQENGTMNDALMDAWDDYYYRFLRELRELDERFDFSGGVRDLVPLGAIFADRDGNVLMRVTEVNVREGAAFGVRAQPANVSTNSGGLFFNYARYSPAGATGWGPVGAVPPLLPYAPISPTSSAWRSSVRRVRINDRSRSAGSPSKRSEPVRGIDAVRSHRGHLIANSLGGPGNFASGNIVAMTPSANLSQMKTKFEDPIRNALMSDPMKNDPANNIIFEVRVTPSSWDPTNSYPTAIHVEYEKLHPIPQPAVPDTVTN